MGGEKRKGVGGRKWKLEKGLTKLRDAAIALRSVLLHDHRRQDLERDRVAGHRGEVVVPEPFGALDAALDADALVRAEQLLLLRARGRAEVLGETGAHDDDVAVLELHALPLRDLLEDFGGDGVLLEAAVLDPFVLGIGLVVDHHAAAHHAAGLVPVVQGWEGHIFVLVAEGLDQLVQLRLVAVVI